MLYTLAETLAILRGMPSGGQAGNPPGADAAQDYQGRSIGGTRKAMIPAQECTLTAVANCKCQMTALPAIDQTEASREADALRREAKAVRNANQSEAVQLTVRGAGEEAEQCHPPFAFGGIDSSGRMLLPRLASAEMVVRARGVPNNVPLVELVTRTRT